MAKRFTDNAADAAPDGSDIVPGTDVSLGDDRKYTFNTLGSFVKTFIGNATVSLNGLMSSADKTKMDGYAVHNPGNDLYLTTNGSGVQTWIAKPSATGDMTKAVYDTNNDGTVDSADEATAISGTPGNDKVYTTNSLGNQTWINKGSINVKTPVNNPTTPYTPSTADVVIWDATAGNKVVRLPDPTTSSGFIVDVKKDDTSTNTVTVDASFNSGTIDGAADAVLTLEDEAITVFCDGTEWHILAS